MNVKKESILPFSLFISLTLIFMVFAINCGGDDDKSGTTTTTTTTTTGTTETTAEDKAEADKYGGVLVFGKGQPAIALDPGIIDEGGSSSVVTQIFESLLTYKPGTTEIVPHLAESYSFSSDGKAISFKLRRDVKFHDGTKMDADAVIFSFERQHDRNHPYHQYGPWRHWNSKRWSDRYDDDGNLISEGFVKAIRKIDDYTVTIEFRDVDASLLSDFVTYFTAIVSPTAVKKHGEDFKSNPVGTGPFKLIEWRKDDITILQKFDDYWGKKPYIDRLIYRIYPDTAARAMALQTGEVDIIDAPDRDNLEQLMRQPGIKILEIEGLTVGYVAINVENPPYDNVKVRRALNHAINKEEIIQGVYGVLGQSETLPMPPSLWGYNDSITPYEYNPAKAKQLLAEAGYPNGFKMELFAMNVSRPYNPNALRVAEIMQAQFKEVGIEAEIMSYEIGTYWDKVDAGEFDLAMTGWSGSADPDSFLYRLFTEGYLNSSRWIHQEYIDIVTEAKRVMDQDERTKLYKKAQQILHDEAPIIMLANGTLKRPMRDTVNGYIMYPTDKLDFTTVWLSK